jgi:precorrin-6A synthase
MDELLVIGVGAGDPDFITVQAVEALARTDVIFELDRATADLTAARDALARRYAPQARTVVVAEPRRDRDAADYEAAVTAWRDARAQAWAEAIAGADGVCAFLVWGDPAVYDSTIAILDGIGVPFRVIAGISSIAALCAAHAVALNRVAGEVLITTGRKLSEFGWPVGATDVAVMLDGRSAFMQLLDEPLDIYWGAYLGTPNELLFAGPLSQEAEKISAAIAAAREQHGWIMDTYLLRRH